MVHADTKVAPERKEKLQAAWKNDGGWNRFDISHLTEEKEISTTHKTTKQTPL